MSAPRGITQITLAATFTADPILGVMRQWADQVTPGATMQLAPFDSVFQTLLQDDEDVADGDGTSVKVLLVRLCDWSRAGHHPADGAADAARLPLVAERADTFVHWLAARSSRPGAGPCIVAVCPSLDLDYTPELESYAAAVRDMIRLAAGRCAGVVWLDTGAWRERYALESVFSPRADRLGSIPYTRDFFCVLGVEVLRAIHRLTAPPFKVIAVDCDETLWGGVCGEDEPARLVLGGGHARVQSFLKHQREAGMLLCLLSKNNEADVRRVFHERSSDMPLGWSDVTATRINWHSKAENLRSLAEELGLGLESVVFIDDSLFECEQMREALPQVLTLRLPEETDARGATLERAWCFDRPAVTREDRARSTYYREDRKRRELQSTAATVEDFLETLALAVRFERVSSANVARCAQMTQRTNQFNLTTVRRLEADILAFSDDPSSECWVVDVSDRFGSYGLTGLVLATADGASLSVDSFLLSCRVLNRRVEHRMLAHLGERAAARGCTSVALGFRPTPRNEPARAFLEQVRTVGNGHQDAEASTVVLSLDRLAQFLQNVGSHDAVAAPPREPGRRAAYPSDDDTDATRRQMRRARALEHIVEVTANASGIAAACAAARAARTAHDDARMPPPLAAICKVFADALNLADVGPDESFWELGGTSLDAAVALGRMPGLDIADLRTRATPRELFEQGERLTAGAARFVELCAGQPGAAGSVMVLIPALAGNPFSMLLFAEMLEDVFPGRIVAVKDPLLVRGRVRTIPEAGRAIARDLLQEYAFDTCILGGGSLGACLAYEASQALARAGRPASMTWMIDPPVYPRDARQRVAIAMAHLQIGLGCGPRVGWQRQPRMLRTVLAIEDSTGPGRFRRALRWADPSWPDRAAPNGRSAEDLFRSFMAHIADTASPDEVAFFRAVGVPRIPDLGLKDTHYACASWRVQAGYQPRGPLGTPLFLIWDKRTAGVEQWRRMISRGDDLRVQWMAHGSAPPHMYLGSPENTQKYRHALRRAVAAHVGSSAQR